MNIAYRVQSEWPNILCRRVYTDDGIRDEMWSAVDDAWIHSETACAINCGFESSRDISEAEAIKIVDGKN